MTARILITGATGMVGKEVLRKFAAVGVAVRAAVHKSDHFSTEFHASRTIEPVSFDFTDQQMIDNALKDVDMVLMITPSVSDLSEYVRIFLHRAKHSHISHIVKISNFGTGMAPMIKLSGWHHEAELLLQESGINHTIVRVNSLMQYFFSCMQPMGGLLDLPLGRGAVSFIDARDVAVALLEIFTCSLKHSNKVYNLTGPQMVSLFKATSIISEVIGQHVEYVDISEETARHVMESTGMPAWRIDLYLELYAFYRAGLASNVTDHYQHITGAAPKTLADFAKDHEKTLRAIVEHEEQ